MGENRFPCGSANQSPSRETIAIETNRILDSCRDRDCYEDVAVILTDFGNDVIQHTTNVRAKDACIAWTNISIEPVRFNRGFYAVNIKFYIKICFEACVGNGRSQEFDGIAVLEKRVILYGSESNVSIFKSSPDTSDYCAVPKLCCAGKNVPIAVVEVVDPIILNVKVREHDHCCKCCCSCDDIPDGIASTLSGSLVCTDEDGRYLTVSLGIFSVVRIVRPAQYLINASEYCVPDKECVSAEDDDPCSIFRQMAFPTSEFCPPELSHTQGDHPTGRCSCHG